MGSTNENLNRLVRLVETGNPWSATYLVSHLKHLDGGNLEDSLIAIGMFGDHDAEGLLTFAKSGNLSDRELKSVLMMLPLSMSDDLDTQFRIMQERRMRVARVSRLDLAGKKDMALKSIDEFLTRLAANK